MKCYSKKHAWLSQECIDNIKLFISESLPDIEEDPTSQGTGQGNKDDDIGLMLRKNIDDDVLGMLDPKTMQDFISFMGSDQALPSTSTTTGKCLPLVNSVSIIS